MSYLRSASVVRVEVLFFFSSRRRHTRFDCDWSSDVCSSDLRWDPILAALRDPDLDVLILDSTAVRAHPCAAGSKKSGTGLAARTIRRLAAAGGIGRASCRERV